MPDAFVTIPQDTALALAWPTPNHLLFTQPERFFARTRANPDYGKPGWTRECGKRFHRGCDIAPVKPEPTGKTTVVYFTDCATGREYPSAEPTWTAQDDVFAVADGLVVEREDRPDASTYGCHLILEHGWPATGERFYSLYAHLSSVLIPRQSRIPKGSLIGRMGQTSSSPDARNWMAIAPHLHLEFRDEAGASYDPVEMLRKYVRR